MGADSGEYNFINCVQQSYKKEIRDTKDKFFIEDYEVFQISKRDD